MFFAATRRNAIAQRNALGSWDRVVIPSCPEGSAQLSSRPFRAREDPDHRGLVAEHRKLPVESKNPVVS